MSDPTEQYDLDPAAISGDPSQPSNSALESGFALVRAIASRHGQAVGVYYLDLDNFLRITTSMGRSIGDEVLRAISARLANLVRRGDEIMSLGGDRFLILSVLPDSSRELARFAGRIIEAVRSPMTISGRKIEITASLGISSWPADSEQADTLSRRAENAMRRAKTRGGNTFDFGDPKLTRETHDRIELERDLRLALEHNELYLVWQPQVDASGNVPGAEALLRWHHPARGPIPPSVFIPLAEETGLIVPIGNWVLQQVARQGKRWFDAGLRLRVAANVSALQFSREDFLDSVRVALAESQLSPELLELEITESLLMRNTDDAVQKLESIRAMGVHTAIDDFGTGYSSLSYLHKLPLDALKIDRSFVAEVGDTGLDQPMDARTAVIRCIVGLARALNLKIVAEGVETQFQRRYLAKLGCDLMQGYLFARPVATGVLPQQIEQIRSQFSQQERQAA